MKSILLAGVGGLLLGPGVFAQLNQNCTVSILNQTAQVQPDGSWRIDNVPAPSGPVRARATCVANGIVQTGQTAIFTVGENQVTSLDAKLATSTPIPNQIRITAPVATLTTPNQTVALTVKGTFADNSTKDLTKAASGTTYRISSSTLATISADGVVTAKASGALLVQAINEGAQGLLQLAITLSGDSDGDGIPDDVEIREGLDPNNPADAMDDPDHDGLTNLEEFRAGTDMHNPDTDGDGLTDGQEVKVLHTNPLMKDTDGDGVPDNVEVATGSDPLNPASFNLAAALSGIRVAPPTFSLGTNAASGAVQLAVTGDFKLGGTVDLTAKTKGTTYASSNLSSCAFGAADGQVNGLASGSCVITVKNNGFTATSTGTVSTFTPKALSKLDLPGYANGVEAVGNFAYVAAGAAGLVVVNVADPAQPQLVKTFNTPGNANGLRVVGNFAFLAAGDAGLQVINVSNPAAPVLVGSVDLPGEALDLNISGNRAYVASGDSGFSIVNIANPVNPTLTAQVATPGRTRGVDVFQLANNSLFAAVAADRRDSILQTDETFSLYVVDITDPTAGFIVANLNPLFAVFNFFPQSVRMVGSLAYVAGYGNGVPVIDLSNPSAPVVIAGASIANASKDIKVAGKVLIVPDQFNANAAYFTDISKPAQPSQATAIDLTPVLAGALDGTTSVAIKGPFVYITANSLFDQLKEKGTVQLGSPTSLVIAQYAPQQDSFGKPPQVTLTEPALNSSVLVGSIIALRATATDDIAVGSTTFQVNGTDVFTDDSEPYQAFFTVAPGTTGLTVIAKAKDFGNNAAASAATPISVIADPLTTLSGRVLRANGSPVTGAAVTCFKGTAVTNVSGQFNIAGFPAATGNTSCTAAITEAGRTLRGKTGNFTLVAAGITNIGDLTVRDFPRILLISDKLTQTTTSIVKELSESGADVTLRPPPQTSWDNTNPALTNFDCVVHLNGRANPPVFSTPAQQALVAFVRAGGGYVGFAPNPSDDASTSPMHDLTLYPGTTTIAGFNGPVTYTKAAGQESHPVNTGFPATFTFFSREDYKTSTTFFPFTEAPPVDVLTIGNPSVNHGVSVRQLGSGRVVRFAASENIQDPTIVPDLQLLKLIGNASRWACNR